MTEEFLQLYSSSQRRMYAYLRTQMLNVHDANDVFQEAALILWRNFDRYDRSQDFTRWACGIIRNQVLVHHRHRGRLLALFREETADAIGEDMLRLSETASERADALPECIQQLAPHAQDLLRRRYRSDKTVKDLALELGRQESAIYKALKRIHDALHDCIEAKLSRGRTV